MYSSCDAYAAAFKALSDETRLKIFLILREGEKCACQLHEQFNCTQPTISYHMRVLTDSGLVESRRCGATTCYSVRAELGQAVGALIALLPERTEDDQA